MVAATYRPCTTEPNRSTLLSGVLLVDGQLASQTARSALPLGVTKGGGGLFKYTCVSNLITRPVKLPACLGALIYLQTMPFLVIRRGESFSSWASACVHTSLHQPSKQYQSVIFFL